MSRAKAWAILSKSQKVQKTHGKYLMCQEVEEP